MGLLEKLFGPSRAKVWAALCEKVGGELTQGGFFGTDRIQLEVGPNRWMRS